EATNAAAELTERHASLRGAQGEDGRERVDVIGELLPLGAKEGTAGGSGLVVSRAAAVLGLAPFAGDEAALFHSMEGLDERGVDDHQAGVRALVEPGSDLEPVHGAPGQGLEDEDVEGAFEQGHVY